MLPLKKLNAEIIQNFPALSDDEVLSFLPSKADVNLIKAYCYKGEIANIYQIQKEPLFFKIDKSPELYPTVYLLYKFPYLLRTFTTSTPVVSKLMQGADLMLPGIHVKGELKLGCFGRFEKGALVAVNTDQNASPFAVGKTALSSLDMYMSANQGKDLNCDIVKSGENGTCVESLADHLQESDILNDDFSNSSSKEKNIISSSAGPEDMDELFIYCFIKALKTSAKKVELPILTSSFFRSHMVNACPPNKTLDVKKTSYKKLSKFLNAMARRNFVEVKEFPKGVENITAINFAHEEIKNFVMDESDFVRSIPDSKPSSTSGFVAPVLEEVYQVSGSTIQFFKKNRYSKGDVLSRAEIRSVVSTYIEENKLKRDDKVELDPILHEAVVNPKEGYKEFLRWDEIFSRLLGKMAPAVRITREGQVPLIKKGKLEPIEIAIAKRTGNKKVTLIYNVGTYGIDESEFAHQIQVGVATSTSVGPAENKPQGMTQVLVQGNQVLFIGKLLLDTYKLPRKYIKGLELAQKKKK
ncbi:Eukaryotic translation initiation factor 2D [Armadillidium nasatum]|uniref:Eukaryotic translation initiation factor 2D n=1 Tax=Armadillidium nasatum TaxID=96803 RepID=A0A5N5SIB7_9CRUS|nr:Eukaryotic translation initiation factor 2D [Armadillidium nasatum]